MSFTKPFLSKKKDNVEIVEDSTTVNNSGFVPVRAESDNPMLGLDDDDDEELIASLTSPDVSAPVVAPAIAPPAIVPPAARQSGLPLNVGAGSGRTLPTVPNYPSRAVIGESAVFNTLISDDNDEEEFVVGNQPVRNTILLDGEDPTMKKIETEIKRLKEKYPTGGLKSSRFITADILLEAPGDYFDKYESEVKLGVNYVRNKITESGQSEKIRAAQDHPTDDSYQNEAYYVANSLAAEYATRSIWRYTEKSILVALICNEVIGFGRIDPLWRDRKIDEIMCNGPYDVQVEIRGEIRSVPSCKFDNTEHLMELLERLYRAIGKTITQTTPLMKGRLHDKSRMFATHPSISPDGPNFAIRRHPSGYWIPEELVKRGAASAEVMTFIGNTIYKGGSFVVIGGTHSGKTSMLNALTGFYKPAVRILTLEDNLEMKPNPKKKLAAAMECRSPSVDRQGDTGVTMRDLVKGSLQLRPDVIIVGEVTDDAAYDLCQALNTGHPGASTIHANGSEQAVTRISSLIAQGGLVTTDGALDMIASAFDIVVAVRHFPVDGSRRIVSVDEVGTTPVEINGRLTLPTRQLWRFVDEGLDENRKVTGYWEKVNDISQERRDNKLLDLESDKTWEELRELSSLPDGEEKA